MKILVIGSGGREHALVNKLAQEGHNVFAAPGNAGTSMIFGVENVPIEANDTYALRNFALEQKIDYTIVGPEEPLVRGIVNFFRASGLKIVGCTKEAAFLEGSKVKAYEFMVRHGIPTAPSKKFLRTEVAEAEEYIRGKGLPTVIKVDGLAAGKGVSVCHTMEEAQVALKKIGAGGFGEAGNEFLVSDFLRGEEASFIVCIDSKGHIKPWASSQDHKAVFDGDKGPNTGGMGAYSSAPVVTLAVEEKVVEEIVKPLVEAMAKEGKPFSGILYIGLMIDENGQPRVIEFNVRLGDPETQPLLARLKTPLMHIFAAMLDGWLNEIELEWDPQVALSVVMTNGGYPGDYKTGWVISGIEEARATGAIVDHAGTTRLGDMIMADGGRVVCVTALGEDFAEAQKNAYKAVEMIHWEGEYHRNDIGWRAVNR